MDPVMAQMTALRRRMIDDMTVRNLSPATQQSYVYAVAKFSRFFGCSPDRLGIEEVRAYQLHLAGLGWSWSHINQVSCALRFFFGVTLGRPEAFDRIISAKEPKKLPVVLSGEEIVRFLQAVPGLRNRRRLAEDGARPVIFYPRGGTCRQPWVKGLTIMVNSIYNGWRYEDVWLDK
jgi:integrase/recombinase XerD